MLIGSLIIVSIAAFLAGIIWNEWGSTRKTARYIDQFNNAARPNTRKGE